MVESVDAFQQDRSRVKAYSNPHKMRAQEAQVILAAPV